MKPGWKRLLAGFLSLVMMFMIPGLPVFATAEGDTEQENVCPHHAHDESCGYSEGSPCLFDPAQCERCGSEGEPDEPEEEQTVGSENPAAVKTVLSWEWINDESLAAGTLIVSGVNEENPVDFPAVSSLLPTAVSATVEGIEENVELPLTWFCAEFPTEASGGDFLAVAELPQGYIPGPGTSQLCVPVILENTVTPRSVEGKPTRGDGTENNPYQLTSEAELYWFAALINGTLTDGTSQNAGACAVLKADIILNTGVLTADGERNEEASDLRGWVPIGNDGSPFTGVFDGGGHTISGLYLPSDSFNQGFVGNLGKGGILQGLKLKDSYVSGSSYVGGLCGYSRENGVIRDCIYQGRVSSNGNNTGGICGSLENSTISNCSYMGILSGNRYTGGICGYVYNSTVSGSFNSGTVRGSDYTGGISGSIGILGAVSNCLNTGSVNGGNNTGGICGKNHESGTLSNCLNIGRISGGWPSGGVCGGNDSTDNITGCYYLDTSAETGIQSGVNKSIPATAEELASGEVAYFLNGSTSDNPVWYQTLDSGQNSPDSYPVLDSAHGVVYRIYNGCYPQYSNIPGGAETPEHTYDSDGFCSICGTYEPAAWNNDRYEISNAGQLYWFAGLINGTLTDGTQQDKTARGTLLNNITINENVLTADGELSSDGSSLRSWIPIGSDNDRYVGCFDGGGYTISGLYINTGESNAGFIGWLGNGGSVQNLILEDSYIRTTVLYAGGIVSRSWGTIKNCHNRGSVISIDNNVGGICACNEENGIIEDCSNSGIVQGKLKTGGICGWNYKGYAIIGCSNTGIVRSSSGETGGICGDNNESTLFQDCTNYGAITGTYNVGGICGVSNRSLTECCNAGNVTGVNSSTGGICGSVNGSVMNCLNSGVITGSYDAGGICGYKNGNESIQNCYSTGNIFITTTDSYYQNHFGGICGNITDGSTENCYYLDTACSKGVGGSGSSEGAQEKTSEEFASGEVAYLLNDSSSTDPVWYQNLDNGQEIDAVPVLDASHGVVYRMESQTVIYSNNPELVVVHVDITWGSLSYIYDEGTWNPEMHLYEGSAWKADAEGGDTITIQNAGNAPVSFTFDYQAVETGIAGEFLNGEDPMTGPEQLPVGESRTVVLSLEGQPAKTMKEDLLGSVTVTIGGETNEE